MQEMRRELRIKFKFFSIYSREHFITKIINYSTRTINNNFLLFHDEMAIN